VREPGDISLSSEKTLLLVFAATIYGAILYWSSAAGEAKEVREKRRREIPVRIHFDPNRLEEQSLLAAYELVVPVAEKDLLKRPCTIEKKNHTEYPAQLAIALSG